MKKFGYILIAILLCVAGAAYLFGKQLDDNKETKKEGKIVETETSVSGEVIRAGLADIGELATEEYYFTEVETYDSSKKIYDFNIPFTTSRFVYSYDGTIKAGIDFAKVSVEKDEEKKTIRVTLPQSKILSSEIDEGSFRVYDEKQSIFNPVSISNFNATNADLKARAEEDAIGKGVLDKADKNAVMLIENFLMSTYDVSEYKIKVETAK